MMPTRRTPYTALLLGAVVLVSVGCLQPRKVEERRAAKAAAILAEAQVRAAKLCPGCVFQDTVHTAGDSTLVQMPFAYHLYVDSLLADCQQYAEALDAERALYIHVLANQVPDTVLVPVRALAPPVRKAVGGIRKHACQFEPLHYESDVVKVEVKPGVSAPLLSVEEKPRNLLCPPCVGKTVFVDRVFGVATWWRTLAVFLLITMACSLAWVLWAFLKARPYPSNTHER